MTSRFGDENCSNKGEVEVVPDVMGSLYGLRSFDLDPDTGYLTGVFYKARWTEGIMEAQCFQTEKAKVIPPSALSWNLLRGKAAASTHLGYDFEEGDPVLKVGRQPVPCPGLARGNHGCGFYAVHQPGTKPPEHYVAGVVEMFGQVELGPLGLRSSQARLVALARPEAFGTRVSNAEVNGRLSVKYEQQVSDLLERKPSKPGWLANFDELKRYAVDQAAWKYKLDKTTKHLLAANERERDALRDLEMFDATTRWLYPNTPVFDSLESMLAAFPVPPLDHLFQEES